MFGERADQDALARDDRLRRPAGSFVTVALSRSPSGPMPGICSLLISARQCALKALTALRPARPLMVARPSVIGRQCSLMRTARIGKPFGAIAASGRILLMAEPKLLPSIERSRS